MDDDKKFKSDMDRHAWRDYAGAATKAIMAKGELGPLNSVQVNAIVESADIMLAEERKRRQA